MATTRTFNDMLNQFTPTELLVEELVKRDWILQNAPKDESWLGGDLVVPFKGARASNIKFGGLTDASGIGQSNYQRGTISTQPEAWMSLIFNERDLMEHGKISEQNFLRLLPDELEDGMDFLRESVSLQFLNDSAICKLVTDGTAAGVCTVDRPERLQLYQEVYVKDDNSAVSAAGYIQSINMDTGEITLDTTRAGGSDLNISAYTVAQNAKLYLPGADTAPFTSLKKSLLPASNTGISGAGSTTLYGKTKSAFPYLQAIFIDASASGANWSKSTLLYDIFNGYTKVKNRGKGMPNKVVMSYNNLGAILTFLETAKGQNNYTKGAMKTSVFGWEEVVVHGVKGTLTLVGVQEVDDDYIMYLDMRAMKIYSNGGFKKRTDPQTGNEYFVIRNTSGYQYVVDFAFFGDLVLHRPSYCGIAANISINYQEN